MASRRSSGTSDKKSEVGENSKGEKMGLWEQLEPGSLMEEAFVSDQGGKKERMPASRGGREGKEQIS